MDDKVKTDRSDDWELVSKFEADRDSVPYISFPKMHEFIEDSDSISYGTGTESNRKNDEGLVSPHVCESEMERKCEGKQEQISPNEQYEKSEKLRRDTDEVMKDKFFHRSQEQENKKVGSEIVKAMQVASQIEQENDRVQREMLEALQDVSQNKRDNDRVRREMEEVMQDNTFTSIDSQCSKSQIHGAECKSLAKAEENKSKVLNSEFNEAFRQFFKVNAVVRDKVTTEAVEVDELEKEKDLWVKINSEDLELFRNEEFDNSSSDEENKEMDKFSKKENY